MRLVIATEERFDRTPDGAVWSTAQGHYGFWQRYLAAFDEVAVVARVRPVNAGAVAGVRADGAGVSFIPVPHYHGPWQYTRRYPQVRNALQAAFGPDDAILFRLPAHVATTMAPAVYRQRRPYGVEVVGDPYDVFAPGAVTHPLRPFFRWSYTRAQQRQVRNAAVAAFVTEDTLQRRYPPGRDAFSTHYSSVELPSEAYVTEPKMRNRSCGPLELVTVASFAHMYKGVDVLLRSARRAVDSGTDLRLRVAGDGRHRPDHERLAAELGLAERVMFLGQLPSSEAVRDVLDQSDVFILASRTEGLPRSMIEAMARGLPCIGTRVGGIPELLGDDMLVPSEDDAALAERIMMLAADRGLRQQSAVRNLEIARSYASDILRERRIRFYSELRKVTEQWLQRPGGSPSFTC